MYSHVQNEGEQMVRYGWTLSRKVSNIGCGIGIIALKAFGDDEMFNNIRVYQDGFGEYRQKKNGNQKHLIWNLVQLI